MAKTLSIEELVDQLDELAQHFEGRALDAEERENDAAFWYCSGVSEGLGKAFKLAVGAASFEEIRDN